MRNAKIYKIFDAHCDTLSAFFENKQSLTVSNGMVKFDYLKSYSAYLQIFACFVDDNEHFPLEKVLNQSEIFRNESEKGCFVTVQNKQDIQNIFSQNKIGGMLSLENGTALSGKIENLYLLYNQGFRMIGLTWNGDNSLASGIYGSGGGLTEFGTNVVEHADKLGMAIDLSHISERGFWDVLDVCKKPVVVSHSNARKICNHPRNLTNEQIVSLIKRKGFIGINFYPPFVSDGECGIKDVIKHVEHVCSLGGENAVGIGSDFDGIKSAVKGIDNANKIYLLLDEMKKLGYSDKLIRQFSHKNLVDVFARVLN